MIPITWYWFSFAFFMFYMVYNSLIDVYAHQKPENTDGKGYDFPPWLITHVHIYQLLTIPFEIAGLIMIGMYSPFGLWYTFLVVAVLAFGLSVVWDCTYNTFQRNDMFGSLKYWLRIVGKGEIGVDSRGGVILFAIIRVGIVVISWYIFKAGL
jgi:hypothetical protein